MSPFVLGDGPLADPTGVRVAAVFEKYAAPAAVLAAPPGDLFDRPVLRRDYADDGRQYPVHTKLAAWASAAAYHDAGSDHPEVGARIRRACDVHRLWGEWDRLKAAAAADRAARAPRVTRWALPDRKKYPLDTAEQVKAAAAYFARYADRLPAADRKTYAGELVKAAAGTGGLPPAALARLEAEAGLGRPAADPGLAFRTRAAAAVDPALKAALLKAAAAAGGLDPLGAADLLRRVDRRVGWDAPDPLAQLVGETPTTAREKLAGVVEAATGNWYRLADLDRVPDATVAAVFGTGPVVSRDAKAGLLKAASTARAFEDVLRGHGVAPAERARRPRVDWAGLAAAGGAA